MATSVPVPTDGVIHSHPVLLPHSADKELPEELTLKNTVQCNGGLAQAKASPGSQGRGVARRRDLRTPTRADTIFCKRETASLAWPVPWGWGLVGSRGVWVQTLGACRSPQTGEGRSHKKTDPSRR